MVVFYAIWHIRPMQCDQVMKKTNKKDKQRNEVKVPAKHTQVPGNRDVLCFNTPLFHWLQSRKTVVDQSWSIFIQLYIASHTIYTRWITNTHFPLYILPTHFNTGFQSHTKYKYSSSSFGLLSHLCHLLLHICSCTFFGTSALSEFSCAFAGCQFFWKNNYRRCICEAFHPNAHFCLMLEKPPWLNFSGP